VATAARAEREKATADIFGVLLVFSRE